MDINALVSLAADISNFISSNNISQNYKVLANALTQLVQTPTDATSKQIAESRAALVEAHRNFQRKLGLTQQQLLDQLGAPQLFGEPAESRIERAFSEHQADPPGAAREIQQILKETNEFNSRMTTLVQALGPLGKQPEPVVVGEAERSIFVLFQSRMSVKSLQDLKSVSSTWDKIMLGFTRLADTPAEVKIAAAVGSGSVWLALVTHAAAVGVFATAIIPILEVIERIQNIRLKGLEMDEMIRTREISEERGQRIRKEYEEEAKSAEEEEKGKILQRVLKEAKKTKVDGEIQNNVQISVDLLFKFFINGGRVDVGAQEAEPDLQESKTFEKLQKRTRELEKSFVQTQMRYLLERKRKLAPARF